MSDMPGSAHPLPKVALTPITRDNWLAAIALRVRPDQEGFVPSVAVSLAKVAIRPDGPAEEHRSFGVKASGEMVGFGQIIGEFGTAQSLWIGGLLVDARFQGRGLGRASVAAFVQLAADEPSCRAVGPTVEPHNEHARKLYLSPGFEPTGRIWDGELVHLLVLEPTAP